MKQFRDTLDKLIPLDEGSFANVVDLGIDIPMRYAECYLVLDDGRRVRLKDRHQLLGWSGGPQRRSFYFQADTTILCVRTNSAHRVPVRMVELWDDRETVAAYSPRDAQVKKLNSPAHKITTVDGSLLFVASRPTADRARAPESRRTQPMLPIRRLADAHAG